MIKGNSHAVNDKRKTADCISDEEYEDYEDITNKSKLSERHKRSDMGGSKKYSKYTKSPDTRGEITGSRRREKERTTPTRSKYSSKRDHYDRRHYTRSFSSSSEYTSSMDFSDDMSSRRDRS